MPVYVCHAPAVAVAEHAQVVVVPALHVQELGGAVGVEQDQASRRPQLTREAEVVRALMMTAVSVGR